MILSTLIQVPTDYAGQFASSSVGIVWNTSSNFWYIYLVVLLGFIGIYWFFKFFRT